MNKPIMLITGVSRGIGHACAEHFSKSYQIAGISRSESQWTTDLGDLTDVEFRNALVKKYNPAVFVNNAGSHPLHAGTVDTIRLNAESAVHLLTEFYGKMTTGHIVNVSSWMATYGGKLSVDDMIYKSTKLMLKSVSNDLTLLRLKPISVTCLEPQTVNTSLTNPWQKQVADSCYSSYNHNSFTPMTPEYIASVIEWIITQPPWVTIPTLELSNSCARYDF